MNQTNEGISRRSFVALGAMAATGVLMSQNGWAAPAKRRVIVWSEGTAPKDVYPKDINTAIAESLKTLKDWDVVTATITDPGQGVPEDSLNAADVLIWWGHKRHDEVKNETVDRIVKRVKEGGMGFISLHSSHFARPYRKLMGTECSWSDYSVDGSSVKITVKTPDHPIAKGIKDFDLPQIERYSEPFAVPTPDAVVFDGLLTRGDGKKEPSRMGLTWTVGKGKVFYFQPGHETFPDFMNENVKQIIRNAVTWAAPQK